ncbi:MAG: glycosyltransferase family 2 protein [Longimicrobiales bacterium]
MPPAPIIALIPAYNAAHLIGPVIEAAGRHLPVTVVDDGSTDGTAAAAEAAGARVIRQRPNQGKGVALRNGFQHALSENCEAVLTLDADGQHDPAEIPKFLEAYRARGADLIIGYRDFDAMPLSRKLANKSGTTAFSWALGEPIRDNQSGYRLIRRRLMDATHASGESGFEFEVEMIVLCVQHGYRLDWVPIRTIYAGAGSHIRPVEHVVNFLRVVWKTWRTMATHRDARAGLSGS